MFTGIIEGVGQVIGTYWEKTNLVIKMKCDFTNELQMNQSVAHNGICLSIKEIYSDNYEVCAIKESLQTTNLKLLNVGDLINLERCLKVGERIDGHIVQGHVDCSLPYIKKEEVGGSWVFTFKYPKKYDQYLVPKGSICINGISLTLSDIDPSKNEFSVSIIPYTFQNTNIRLLKKSDLVNIEFDCITKQIARLHHLS